MTEATPRGTARMATAFTGLLSAELVIRGFTVIAGMITVRALTPNGFGEFTYALAFAGIVGVAVDFGLSVLLLRDVSAKPETSATLLGSTLVAIGLVGVSAFAVAVVLTLSGVITGAAGSGALLTAFGAAGVDAIALAFEATLIGHGHAGLLGFVRAARGATFVAAAVVVAIWASTPQGFLVAFLAGSVAGASAAALTCAARVVRPRFAHAMPGVFRLLRRALPVALLGASYLLYSRIDLVMLGLIDGRRAAGEYGVAARVLEMGLLIPIYFGSAFLTTIAQTVDGKLTTPPTPDRVARALRAGLLIGVPLSFALALSGPWVIDLIAGRGYAAAGDLLVRLSPIVGLVACYAVLSNLQLALDRLSTLVGIVAVGAMAKIVGNALLIPSYGARGAAATAVGVEVLVVLAQWLAARRLVAGTRLVGWGMRFGGAVLAMLAAPLVLGVIAGATWPVVLVGGLVAFAGFGALGGAVTRAELRAARLTLSQRRRRAVPRMADGTP